MCSNLVLVLVRNIYFIYIFLEDCIVSFLFFSPFHFPILLQPQYRSGLSNPTVQNFL